MRFRNMRRAKRGDEGVTKPQIGHWLFDMRMQARSHCNRGRCMWRTLVELLYSFPHPGRAPPGAGLPGRRGGVMDGAGDRGLLHRRGARITWRGTPSVSLISLSVIHT